MTEVLTARDEADVLAFAKWTLAEETAFEVRGAGSKRGLGHPLDLSHTLDLSALSGVTLYEPEELVLSAGAGTPLAEIEALLAENNQQLAFEPPDYGPLFGGEAGGQTLGGVLSCNLAGARRIKAGAARDHFLGLSGVTGRAEAIKSGGRVVKNVTGYDLCKLLAGSYGTLAALTSVTVKVLPAPERSRTVLIAGLEPAAAGEAMRQAIGGPHEVSGAAHLPVEIATRSGVGYVAGAGASITALRIEGTPVSADHRCAALRDEFVDRGEIEELHSHNTIRLWTEISNVATLLPDKAATLWRLSVTPSAGPAIAQTLGGECYFDWAGGLIWYAGDAVDVRDHLQGQGHATLIRASDEARQAVDVFQPQDAGLAALTKRVKDSFDPKRLLNPGRMYRDV